MSVRTFKLLQVNGEQVRPGIYRGRPGQAAKKAFTQYCKQFGSDTCTGKFMIQEITAGSSKKIYSYTGSRVRVDPPKEVTRGSEVFLIHYETNVHATHK